MSREIKFRIWRAPDEYSKTFWMESWDSLMNYSMSDIFQLDNPDDVLEQYTGLKDTSSKEIYEGDILHFGSVWCVGDEYDPREEDHTGLVEYRPDYASYVVNCNGKIYPLEQVISFDGYSVQGNVHENPELLEADNV
ncbi:hypothetical protein B8W93_01540 [Lentilactobacillus kefiri]|uniref:YopX family protein n=1 Tax=Lentilactobacillus kefiri TaxID=33962 RepID=UPI000BA5D6B3|nr:YopX family protein [Lentilactobacillus kefiri]PAK82919.1 hypothetical protein B8W85_06140 [Lentilactobacillus kefiri]PAL07352.1 hypothetical protein B8W93_01540 [Lentilactobacillus kefiri]